MQRLDSSDVRILLRNSGCLIDFTQGLKLNNLPGITLVLL